jgi:tryptophan-rich hypothetical protein
VPGRRRNKEKHCLVVRLILPEAADGQIECVELEAVYMRRWRTVHWRELYDSGAWHQGWH